MSARATLWAWELQGLTSDEKLVLLCLAEDANHQDQCWPSRAIITHRTGISESMAGGVLASLESKAVLRRDQEAGKSPKVFLLVETAISVTQPARREVVPFVADLSMSTQMDQAMVIWNEMAKRTKAGPKEHRISPIRGLTEAMKRPLAARLKEAGIEGWTSCVLAVEANAHCRGVNDRKWHADFHYLLQAKGFSKALNGGWRPDYEELTNGGQRVGPAGRGERRQDGLRSFDEAVRGRFDPRGGREDGDGSDCGDAGPDGRGQERRSFGLALGPPDDEE